jgi:hypothetical protein
VLPVALGLIPSLILSDVWQQRVAALVAIGAIAEGSLKEMKPLLGQIMECVLPTLADPHPRVCYAACNCIGQMSIDFAPEEGKSYQASLQSQYHGEVIPRLIALSRLDAHPRVQVRGRGCVGWGGRSWFLLRVFCLECVFLCLLCVLFCVFVFSLSATDQKKR